MQAMLIVDVQVDFCPGGALAVQDGDKVVPSINARRGDHPLVVFTQDWHPAGHESFASSHPGTAVGDVIDLHGLQQIMWPDHCVQGTPGAEFHPDLDVRPGDPVFRKGELPTVDSYSGFRDNDRRHETGLRDYLHAQGVTELCVAGLATDVCVKYTVLDALEFGFITRVLRPGCRAVNLHPGDEAAAYREMAEAGAHLID
ncbi:MAG: bifunctional nicotinamidase/pyrazinamidase [Gammaproteobacteria bacterium]|nr:bifunctional nicotinamidase/pyrazinamidase [Gammaproteobacteria bacterium]NIR98963.1 bifunctional nicotinamidase/pyrazinamidase [Gammaproteobacteria bacterium]NIT64601.1 bifunctional nicotinamidase/pyrazinamidase [Gammaproteobacteria bacterium]NIV21574.1 bifunctional nicotinamidase/pyrazinamidase [Gammaproteobacteria bacterium]NIY33181.1 bifunctional nicotinamidase/pyrazinamidase [Gammaproteobacteria bacterium]